ncbi:MAG TPA: hypothetical protein ENK06_09815 [Gammaproteobacteria bacterium]|nr:hypothetical protein [Gammaproteobacteria bacterium]
MVFIKLLFEFYEQALFSNMGATSWLDFGACVLSYIFVSFVAFIVFFLPLSFLFLMFSMSLF